MSHTPAKSFTIHRKPVAFSTPCNDLNKSRPLPTFSDKDHLFQFKKDRNFIPRILPKNSLKNAPPVSRVFPHRTWAHEKAHAISFRLGDEQEVDDAFKSQYYNSDKLDLYFEQCFVIEKKLGEGSFGEVMQVRCRQTNQRYAVKRSREKFRHETDRKRKLDEVRKHEMLPPHRNCVKFIKAWEEKHRLYIQTELCSHSLQSYLDQHHLLPESLVWKYLVDLLHGLNHIHKNGFIHFDVKPANIFISPEDVCKIGDFGLVVDKNTDDIEDAREGDNKYMAPELLEGIFTEKADVFSLGISVLEMACDLDLPSSGKPWQLLRQGHIPPECSKKISSNLRKIIHSLITPEHEKRPSVEEMLNFPIVKYTRWRLKPYTFACRCFFKVLYFINMLIFFFGKARNWLFNFDKNNVTVASEDMWDSTLSMNITNLSENGQFIDTPAKEFINNSSFLTPVGSKLSPAPRNSSPIIHNRAAMIRSPGVSPLSRTCFDFSSKSVNDFETFASDESDGDQPDPGENVDRGFSLKPRNLLAKLNELSDSEGSCNSEDKTF